MKILIINASPRKQGNISQMLGIMQQEAETLGAENACFINNKYIYS